MFNIVKGHINELLNMEDELYSERMEICKKCMHKYICDECNTPSSSDIKIFLDGYIYCYKCNE